MLFSCRSLRRMSNSWSLVGGRAGRKLERDSEGMAECPFFTEDVEFLFFRSLMCCSESLLLLRRSRETPPS